MPAASWLRNSPHVGPGPRPAGPPAPGTAGRGPRCHRSRHGDGEALGPVGSAGTSIRRRRARPGPAPEGDQGSVAPRVAQVRQSHQDAVRPVPLSPVGVEGDGTVTAPLREEPPDPARSGSPPRPTGEPGHHLGRPRIPRSALSRSDGSAEASSRRTTGCSLNPGRVPNPSPEDRIPPWPMPALLGAAQASWLLARQRSGGLHRGGPSAECSPVDLRPPSPGPSGPAWQASGRLGWGRRDQRGGVTRCRHTAIPSTGPW